MYYCSNECHLADWEEIHKYDCKHIRTLKERENSVILNDKEGYGLYALRYCLKSQRDKEFKKRKWTLYDGSERTIDDLMHHVDKSLENPLSFLVNYLGIAKEIFSLNIRGLNLETIVMRIGQLRTNSYTIENDVNQFEPGTETMRGHGLYVEHSIVNHSCIPNVFGSLKGPVYTFRAIREIDTDKEELLVAYTDSTLDVKERQYRLKISFFFDCKCRLCTDPSAQSQLDHITKLKHKLSIKNCGIG